MSTSVDAAPGALTTGVALADPRDGRVLYENPAFTRWFPRPSSAGDTLAERIEALDFEKARARLGRKRPFTCESELRTGAKAVVIDVTLHREEADGEAVIVVECRDISKQKQAEYMLDSYAQLAERYARELHKEKERVEKLMLNIMPRAVYEEMKTFGTVTPQNFERASVLMLDFVQSTYMEVSQDTSALIAELNDIFSTFDRIAEHFGCERIKTMGDAYVAVSGLPEVNPDHATSICRLALRIRRYLERRNASNPNKWSCRIGIASGPLIGSLVGVQKYVYDIFGATANLAARLESHCDPMAILICEKTWQDVRNAFVAEDLGEQELRGFGACRLFRLDREIAAGPGQGSGAAEPA